MKIKTLLIILACLVCPVSVFGQTSPPVDGVPAQGAPEPEVTEKPLQKLTPGVVASSGKFTMRGKALSQGLDESAGEKNPSPVVGSVKRLAASRCAAILSNNSEDATFSVSFELAQSTKETVNSPKKRLFSAVLGPKKSVEREFRCDPTDNLQLSLKSGREIRNK